MGKFCALLAVFTVICCATSLWAEPNFKEGKWEVTAAPEIKGMEGMKIPPQKNFQCLTKKDMVPPDMERGDECKVIEQKVSGDTVSWVMRCKGKDGSGESRGRITYKPDRYDGVVTTITSRPGEDKVEMTTKLSGRYVGPCK
jgi:hypothetical protein